MDQYAIRTGILAKDILKHTFESIMPLVQELSSIRQISKEEAFDLLIQRFVMILRRLSERNGNSSFVSEQMQALKAEIGFLKNSYKKIRQQQENAEIVIANQPILNTYHDDKINRMQSEISQLRQELDFCKQHEIKREDELRRVVAFMENFLNIPKHPDLSSITYILDNLDHATTKYEIIRNAVDVANDAQEELRKCRMEYEQLNADNNDKFEERQQIIILTKQLEVCRESNKEHGLEIDTLRRDATETLEKTRMETLKMDKIRMELLTRIKLLEADKNHIIADEKNKLDSLRLACDQHIKASLLITNLKTFLGNEPTNRSETEISQHVIKLLNDLRGENKMHRTIKRRIKNDSLPPISSLGLSQAFHKTMKDFRIKKKKKS
jgi:hypothetical protein